MLARSPVRSDLMRLEGQDVSAALKVKSRRFLRQANSR